MADFDVVRSVEVRTPSGMTHWPVGPNWSAEPVDEIELRIMAACLEVAQAKIQTELLRREANR